MTEKLFKFTLITLGLNLKLVMRKDILLFQHTAFQGKWQQCNPLLKQEWAFLVTGEFSLDKRQHNNITSSWQVRSELLEVNTTFLDHIDLENAGIWVSVFKTGTFVNSDVIGLIGKGDLWYSLKDGQFY